MVTDAGGNKEVIANNKNGIVTKNDDAAEFSQAILKLTEDEVLFNQYASAASARFTQLFDVSVMIKRFADLYEN